MGSRRIVASTLLLQRSVHLSREEKMAYIQGLVQFLLILSMVVLFSSASNGFKQTYIVVCFGVMLGITMVNIVISIRRQSVREYNTGGEFFNQAVEIIVAVSGILVVNGWWALSSVNQTTLLMGLIVTAAILTRANSISTTHAKREGLEEELARLRTRRPFANE